MTAAEVSNDRRPRFELFGRLPVELQVMIWDFAIYTVTPPRVIKIFRSSKPGRLLFTTAKIPGLLHTCSRARTAALKVYEAAEFNYLYIPRSEVVNKPRIYFDCERDFIYQCTTGGCSCPPRACGRYILGTDSSKIRRLAIEDPRPCWFFIEMNYANVRDVMVLHPGQGMKGGWAYTRDFEMVEEPKEKMTLIDFKNRSVVQYPKANWTIEAAWRAKYIVDLTDD